MPLEFDILMRAWRAAIIYNELPIRTRHLGTAWASLPRRTQKCLPRRGMMIFLAYDDDFDDNFSMTASPRRIAA